MMAENHAILRGNAGFLTFFRKATPVRYPAGGRIMLRCTIFR
jgi:hypothetical protein